MNARPSSHRVVPTVYRTGVWSVTFGQNSGKVQWRLRGPANAVKYALLLSATPGTLYFSNSRPESARIANDLVRDHKVMEIRHRYVRGDGGLARTTDGYYTLGLAQGHDAAVAYAGALYDLIVAELGYTAGQRLVGIGGSLGGVLLHQMCFYANKTFTRIAECGVLMGDVPAGCDNAGLEDGIGYASTGGVDNFDYLTASKTACTDKNIEEITFATAPYKTNPVVLGLFEGNDASAPVGNAGNGHVAQAEIIRDQRVADGLGAITELHTYGSGSDGCGHSVFDEALCGTQPVTDVLAFIRG